MLPWGGVGAPADYGRFGVHTARLISHRSLGLHEGRTSYATHNKKTARASLSPRSDVSVIWETRQVLQSDKAAGRTHASREVHQRRPARHTQHIHSCKPASAGIQNCASMANAGISRIAVTPAPSRHALPAIVKTVPFTHPPKWIATSRRAHFWHIVLRCMRHATVIDSTKSDSSRPVAGRNN